MNYSTATFVGINEDGNIVLKPLATTGPFRGFRPGMRIAIMTDSERASTEGDVRSGQRAQRMGFPLR